jgi:hypothetical protein
MSYGEKEVKSIVNLLRSLTLISIIGRALGGNWYAVLAEIDESGSALCIGDWTVAPLALSGVPEKAFGDVGSLTLSQGENRSGRGFAIRRDTRAISLHNVKRGDPSLLTAVILHSLAHNTHLHHIGQWHPSEGTMMAEAMTFPPEHQPFIVTTGSSKQVLRRIDCPEALRQHYYSIHQFSPRGPSDGVFINLVTENPDALLQLCAEVADSPIRTYGETRQGELKAVYSDGFEIQASPNWWRAENNADQYPS